MAHFPNTFLAGRRGALALLGGLPLLVAAQTSGTLPAAAPPSASASASAPRAMPSSTLAPVLVTGRSPPDAGVAGWGDVPLAKAPLQATAIDAAQMRDAGARRLSELGRFDASLSDAYDTEGYIDYFTVRGFVIDNRFNFRRDGLPINAETSIPLENKARVDVLKGLSGMQAGTSAPGGLVDLVVKRPTEAPISSAFLEWRQRAGVVGAVDLSRRFGVDGAFGMRLNAAAEHLEPLARDARGERNLVALAGDWRLGATTLVEAEVERSQRSQPSVPGFSLLGDRVPSVPDPRLNLNNQPWSLPVVFDATTASLRITQQLAPDWRLVAHGATQRLRTDDRIAFPFGCTAADGTSYADRFCANGTFDLYDFRSDDERRRSDVVDVSVHGTLRTGSVGHGLVAGVQRSVASTLTHAQAFNRVEGQGRIDGSVATSPSPGTFGDDSRVDRRSTELYARDAISLDARSTLWLGVRHTRLEVQSFTAPFAAASYAFVPGQVVYASWGQGIESEVAPNLPRYRNAGQPVKPAKSRQLELGLKGGSERVDWSAALFDIRRPLFGDVGACDVNESCERTLLGAQRHRGIETQAGWRDAGWDVRGGVQWLHARVDGLPDATMDGKRPTNVPALTLRVLASRRVDAVDGLSLQAGASHESSREVLPDNSVRIPSFTRVDLGARLERRIAGVAWTLRSGVDNVLDRRAWRESPYQFSHVYLFPLAPRTWRVSLQADL
jgi:iron complex outermembrane receptor protein